MKKLLAILSDVLFALMFNANESYSFPIEYTDVNPTPLFGPFLIN